jgi:hypothetical protein
MVNGESWLDRDPADLERLLIEHGRRDGPSAAARRRTLASVTVVAAAGAGLAATSMSAAAAAASTALPWIVATKWVAVGVAAGAVTLGVADRVEHRSSARTEAAHPGVATSPAVTQSVAQPGAPMVEMGSPVVEPGAVEAPSSAEPSIDSNDGARVAPRTVRSTVLRLDEPTRTVVEVPSPPLEPARPSTTARDEGSLEGEVLLLEEARRALDAHAAPKALTVLDRYAQRFPAGRMGIEASALRIETLLALGQRDAASALARSFLATHPRSPAAMRVARLLDAIDSGVMP